MTDYSMPGMSGAAFTRSIRALSEESQTGPSIPVVVFTEHGEAEERDEIAVVKHVLNRLLEPGKAALAARNFPLPSILEEMNGKLLQLLPPGRFSCAILFRMDWHTGEFLVINAAMPGAFLLRALVEQRIGNLALLLSEALINAVDHGALELDPAIKKVDFERYDLERRSRLAACSHEAIELRFSLHLRPDGAGSRLLVRVADPGAGFDGRRYLAESPGKLPGRGLLLPKALGRDLTFNEAGNEVCFSLYASEA